MNVFHGIVFAVNLLIGMAVGTVLASQVPAEWRLVLIVVNTVMWPLCATWPVWRRLGLLPWFRTCPYHGQLQGGAFRVARLNDDSLALCCPECGGRFVYSGVTGMITLVDIQGHPTGRMRPRWPGFTGQWARVKDSGEVQGR